MGLAIGLLLGAILLFWLGTRQRKKVYAEYEDDSQKYTATTTMTLIKQTKSDTVQKPGMQRTGYYEPSNPKNITEYQPQKPVLGGVLFFIPGVVLLIFGVVVLRNSLW